MEAGSPRLSYEDLVTLLTELRARVERLEAENAELRHRLGLNSTNSSKPPSSDGLAKPGAPAQNKPTPALEAAPNVTPATAPASAPTPTHFQVLVPLGQVIAP